MEVVTAEGREGREVETGEGREGREVETAEGREVEEGDSPDVDISTGPNYCNTVEPLLTDPPRSGQPHSNGQTQNHRLILASI